MADQIITERPIKQQSGFNLNSYLLGLDADSYRILISDLAKKIVEDYSGSTLAGSAQAVKTALDSIDSTIGNTAMGTTATTITGAIAEHESDISTLNGKSTLTLTRTENTHVTAQNFNRLSAYKSGNVLCLNGNLSAEYASGFTDFNEIGRISNWSAISDIYVNVPAQNDGSKVICIQIYANGTIRIYSSTAFSGAPFFRFCVSVPCA